MVYKNERKTSNSTDHLVNNVMARESEFLLVRIS